MVNKAQRSIDLHLIWQRIRKIQILRNSF